MVNPIDMNSFINNLQSIRQQGNYNEMPKLNPVAPKQINLSMPGLPNGGGASATGGSELDRLMRAIKKGESSNNYGAINKDSGALGGYQIMPSNLSFGGGDWDQQALGRRVSQQEFMGNSQLQDQIAMWQLGNYLKKYGAAGAAVAWYGGPGSVKNMYSKTTQAGGYPSLYDYWTNVLQNM